VFSVRYEINCRVIFKRISGLSSAVALAVSRWSVIVEVCVRSQVIPCKVCAGQNGAEINFPSSISVFPLQVYSTNAPH
jgi:hypothetical protein